MECLPEIGPSAGPIAARNGVTVTASLVDQQAALFGHGCAAPGDAKITFGTGAFALAVAGEERPAPGDSGVLPSLAWQIAGEACTFALEGGVYNAASAINWARGLGLFSDYGEINAFTGEPAISRNLVFVPALSGLGCPHWDRSAAGLWIGMGLDTDRLDLMRSLLEGIALRAAEVVEAMASLVPIGERISVDGGVARNDYFLSFLARALGRTLTVPSSTETTAMGTARMAMRGAGLRELPDLPRPARAVAPGAALDPAIRGRFGEALRRARGWK